MSDDTLAALIKRVEQATGADAALDGMIWQAVTPGGSWCQNSDGVWLLRVEDDRTPGATGRAYSHPPRYTASLDAAASLVPEGWAASVHIGGARPDMLRHMAALYGPLYRPEFDPVPDRQVIHSTAATPALALTAAALRARMESER